MGRLERLPVSAMARVGRWESDVVSSLPLNFDFNAHPRCVAPIFLGQVAVPDENGWMSPCHDGFLRIAFGGEASKQNGGETEGRDDTAGTALLFCTAAGPHSLRRQPIMAAQPSRGTTHRPLVLLEGNEGSCWAGG